MNNRNEFDGQYHLPRLRHQLSRSINKELLSAILRGTCGNDAWHCEIVVDGRSVESFGVDPSALGPERGNKRRFERTVLVLRSIPVAVVKVTTASTDICVDDATDLVAQSIRHRLERQFYENQARELGIASSRISRILTKLEPTNRLDVFWKSLSDVLNDLSKVIGAHGAIFAEAVDEGSNKIAVRSASGSVARLRKHTYDVTQPEILRVLHGAEGEAVRLDYGASTDAFCVAAASLVPGNSSEPSLFIPVVGSEAALGLMIFFPPAAGGERNWLSPNQNVQLLTSAARHISSVHRVLTSLIEVRKSVEGRREFVHILGHQLAQPLASLHMYAVGIKDPYLGQDKKDRYLDYIQTVTRIWSGFVANLAAAAQVDKGIFHNNPDVHFELHKTASWLIGLAQNMQPYARQQAGCSISVDTVSCAALDDAFGGIVISRSQADQAIQNLLHNAVKYSFPGTTITISAEQSRDRRIIKVQNTGIALDEADRERIFERGYRTAEARRREPGGTGLGLFIVREVMDLHNGEVCVDSTPLGGGRFLTTFTLKFPPEGNNRFSGHTR